MSNKQMKRGRFQSLYKYLPESWIDFSVRGRSGKNYIARVTRWNSEILVDINQKRLIRTVNDRVRAFERDRQAATDGEIRVTPIIGFGSELNLGTCDVLSPKSESDERGIIAEISPTTFYCDKCSRVYQYKDSEEYLSNPRKQKCETCGVDLKQFRQIYVCECGWASDKHNVFCSNSLHGSKYIRRHDSYNFVCTKCHKTIPMVRKCEVCGSIRGPKVALDPAQYTPYSLSLIDLIDARYEEFINNTEYGAYLAIAYWLGFITEDQLKEVVKNGIVDDPEIYQKKFDELYDVFVKMGSEEQARQFAEVAARKACGDNFGTEIQEVKSKMIMSHKDDLNRIAEMIVEYDMVISSDEISTLDSAIAVASLLNTNANPQEFKSIAERYGITRTQVCGKIPFIFASYGYTRDKGIQLHAFPEEKRGRKNIYAAKLDTEGVIFEFNRRMIIEWLLKNKYINKDEAPNIDSETDLKLWFLNHIKLDAIEPFTRINEDEYKETFYVYGLIHSLSHLLIKQASELCGLDSNSLSEYIFPGIPAVLIYCQNSQGFNLGALFNIFEAYFDQWLKGADLLSKKCIFDPICLERYKACAGCLYLNEVSCQHFNKDLDRTFVVGWFDKKLKKAYHGFWEDM